MDILSSRIIDIGKKRHSRGHVPGSWLDKVLEGKPLVYRTEEVLLRVIELDLAERFEKILGITPK